MGLYPTLEDMTVANAMNAQQAQQQQRQQNMIQSHSSAPYPTLTPGSRPDDPPNYWNQQSQTSQALQPVQPSSMAVANYSSAPVSGEMVGIKRAEIKDGLRMVHICVDPDSNKFGLKLKCIDAGVFVSLVAKESPAALVGIRFGDQIVQIDGENLAGKSSDKALKLLKKANPQRCELVLRDRPLSSTITMQKDSQGHVGFKFSNGRISHLVQDSSAARNGLLIDRQICEVNGQNVVGMKDKLILEILAGCGRTVTLTTMPKDEFEHLSKNVSRSMFKSMDHSIPDV
ncbi:Oidioi.mRNA.OKI2018_I69.chr1.g3351.t1.cds [Oikopleura dioica]|uniref:Oidioi.mRNA.OKI2018_I69.chr1.g3351.t1.cds n=1 Tax=Oikopleura dioica TaxID=34765 RepID=A0ABN7T310_OIKDI|nr:Oidioi.mRNA.OKI2018_I69.chr1.g3351.t1.cds [Oikopleura dioica]